MLVEYRKSEKGYGSILINRPNKRNAISEDMIPLFHKYLNLAKQDQLNFLVITSTGSNMFCSGGDLTFLHSDLSKTESFERLNLMKEVLYKIATFPVPVIAVLNGGALGGGCELATACDVRVAKEGTKFGFVQSNLGILPGWGGGVLLYEKVHPTFAFQWLMEGEIIDAKELEKKGWVNRIVPEVDSYHLEEILRRYISKSHTQMKILKKQYIKNRKNTNLYHQMTEEVLNTTRLWGSKEHKLAVRKFLSRK
ncbi:enoyl-CoA hydratase/isomerase family protein [Oceanobacillus senegalensis]|uniref:enoyl-CoA hydratase/isomerase family protein n=1 Tax=Oceanobacillus senegalensis TaxID=1936063 RepID=UPI000A30A0F2|nr:enoyl-CoA hydratase/isomerase family protein [Oceanobacillus senegalensis]